MAEMADRDAAAGGGAERQEQRREESRRGDRGGRTRPCGLENYEKVASIGRGSFGTVSKVRRKQDGKRLALDAKAVPSRSVQVLVWKELDYGQMREKEKQLVVSEVNILRDLRHPFVVRYYDRIIDKANTKIYIVMEFCEGGDLGRVIRRAKRDGTHIDEDFIWQCFTQIVLALKECHRHRQGESYKPILHRDLKPGNIFMDGSRNIKIGDFGLAKELASQSKYAYTNVGTPFYMSPEMINELRYNEKSDIWALGCLIYELCALVPPFEASNQLSLAVKINAGKFSRIPARYSDDLHRAIRWMLQVDHEKRPSVEDLERLPQVRQQARSADVLIREHQVSRSLSSQQRELRQREDDVRRREEAVSARESELERREKELSGRERVLAEREAAVTARMVGSSDDRDKALTTNTTTTAAAPSGFSRHPPTVPPPILCRHRSWERPYHDQPLSTRSEPNEAPESSAGGPGESIKRTHSSRGLRVGRDRSNRRHPQPLHRQTKSVDTTLTRGGGVAMGGRTRREAEEMPGL